jgi:PAS domain S-box-containing protein
MKATLEKRLLALFVVLCAVLVVVAGAAIRSIGRSMASSDWVNHTHAVIIEADALAGSLRAAEAALARFLLSGGEQDRSATREACAEMTEHLEVAKAMTRSEPLQQAKLKQAEPLVTRHIAFLQQVIQARQQQGLEAARRLMTADTGLNSARELQRLLAQLKQDENALLKERDTASYLQAQATRWVVLTGVTLDFLLLAVVAWLIRDDIAARRRATLALEAANEQLESRVRARTAELAQTNQTLKEENLERSWANQSLEHQLRYHQLIIHSINDPILVVSKAINITRINPAVLRRTGYDAPELIGSPLHRVLRRAGAGAPGAPASHDPVALALKEGRELHAWPAELVAKNGQAVRVLVSLFPLRDSDRVVGGVLTLGPANPPAPSDP